MDEDTGTTESKTFKRAQSNLQDKLKPKFLQNQPHHIVPGFNINKTLSTEDLEIEDVIELYQVLPYSCDFPKPLLPPAKLPRAVLNGQDPALQLLVVKNKIDDNINRIVNHCKKYKKELKTIHLKDIKWLKDKNVKQAKIPRYIAEIAKNIEMDPDPYFKGTYNWYYTGGSLINIQLNNYSILLFPFMEELIATPITTSEDFLWKPLLKNANKSEIDDILYELRYSIIGDTCRILGRSKNHCDIYTLSESTNKLSLNQIHRQPSKVPYATADLCFNDKNRYCTANVNRSVALWDITKMKCVTSNTIMKNTVLQDTWVNIKFQLTEPNVLIFTDRCCSHYLDIRIPFDLPALSLCPKSDLEKCECISLNIPSRNSSCRYIGTYHNFLLCDARSPNQCILQKWTHQFKGTPLLGCVTNRDDKEMIVLSSEISGESAIILNTWMDDEKSHSYTLPYTPPHIMDTLKESQLQGLCLDPYLKDRFELCNAGSTLVTNNDGNVFFFVQNSIGDIFYQCISHEDILNKHSSVNCKSYCVLDTWENAILEQNCTVKPLTISNKCNMQHVYQNFTNTNLHVNDKEPIESYFDPSWKQSLDKLDSYIDILAPELLAVWEIYEQVPIPLSAAPHQKVLSWLESAEIKSSFPSQEESEFMPTSMDSKKSINVSQQYDMENLDNSELQQFLPRVRTKPIKKKSKKK